MRGLVARNHQETAKEIEETREMIWEQQPKLDAGKLVFESSDGQGNTVYGHVIAEIKTDQPDA